MSRARRRRDVLVFRPRLLLPLIEKNMKKHVKAEVLFFCLQRIGSIPNYKKE